MRKRRYVRIDIDTEPVKDVEVITEDVEVIENDDVIEDEVV